MEKLECKKCGWRWIPRKNFPKSCPQCKRYDWFDDSKKVKKRKKNEDGDRKKNDI